jgi:hypothetical protein
MVLRRIQLIAFIGIENNKSVETGRTVIFETSAMLMMIFFSTQSP